MMTTVESTKIVTFMTPGTGVLVSGCGYIVKMQFVYTLALIRQIKYMVMMTKDQWDSYSRA